MKPYATLGDSPSLRLVQAGSCVCDGRRRCEDCGAPLEPPHYVKSNVTSGRNVGYCKVCGDARMTLQALGD